MELNGTIVRAKDPAQRPGCFFIGIDFGTTFSGVAWANSKAADQIAVIQQWPGGVDAAFKVPSTIRYQSNGQKQWGFEAPADSPGTLQWFKLLLVDAKDLPPSIASSQYLRQARSTAEAAHKSPQDITRDYLSLLWAHTVEVMRENQGKSVVDVLPFRVVLTVPATWAAIPKIVNLLEKAAEQAGITAHRDCGATTLKIVAEPEAAAFAVIKDAERMEHFYDNDIFMVCDAGGGTVDLITYKIEDMNHLSMGECAEGDGSPCGSIFLDQEMEKCMKDWLGKRWTKLTERERTNFKNDPQKWMRIKRVFDGNEVEPFILDMGQDLTKSLIPFRKKKSELKLDKQDIYLYKANLKTIFDPIIDQILTLVGEQIRRTELKTGKYPKTLILVGGLGGNKYLYNTLKTTYGSRLDIIRRDRDKSIVAVCRGAALKAISIENDRDDQFQEYNERIPAVTSRVSRVSFGISYIAEFDGRFHLEEDKIFHDSSRREMATGLMHWFIKRGDDVFEIDRPSYMWKRCIAGPLPRGQLAISVWKCNVPNPPDSKRGHDDIIVHCTTVSCFIETPFDLLPRCENPAYREIIFHLELVPKGPGLEFVARVNGKICGQQNLSVLFL